MNKLTIVLSLLLILNSFKSNAGEKEEPIVLKNENEDHIIYCQIFTEYILECIFYKADGSIDCTQKHIIDEFRNIWEIEVNKKKIYDILKNKYEEQQKKKEQK